MVGSNRHRGCLASRFGKWRIASGTTDQAGLRYITRRPTPICPAPGWADRAATVRGHRGQAACPGRHAHGRRRRTGCNTRTFTSLSGPSGAFGRAYAETFDVRPWRDHELGAESARDAVPRRFTGFLPCLKRHPTVSPCSATTTCATTSATPSRRPTTTAPPSASPRSPTPARRPVTARAPPGYWPRGRTPRAHRRAAAGAQVTDEEHQHGDGVSNISPPGAWVPVVNRGTAHPTAVMGISRCSSYPNRQVRFKGSHRSRRSPRFPSADGSSSRPNHRSGSAGISATPAAAVTGGPAGRLAAYDRRPARLPRVLKATALRVHAVELQVICTKEVDSQSIEWINPGKDCRTILDGRTASDFAAGPMPQ
ncbi:hypothetical protein QFZ82_008015 [Streptomyces sp. V4I23]|nr:hypothetical protein [Streptomyces sp. V4I23]MDQ1013354.1 hypothetical protein [Streptomyces sp. V4I23]MDQ1013447.1 hypothetical protein [Streptomyces sp. V4I23]